MMRGDGGTKEGEKWWFQRTTTNTKPFSPMWWARDYLGSQWHELLVEWDYPSSHTNESSINTLVEFQWGWPLYNVSFDTFPVDRGILYKEIHSVLHRLTFVNNAWMRGNKDLTLPLPANLPTSLARLACVAALWMCDLERTMRHISVRGLGEMRSLGCVCIEQQSNLKVLCGSVFCIPLSHNCSQCTKCQRNLQALRGTLPTDILAMEKFLWDSSWACHVWHWQSVCPTLSQKSHGKF